MVSRRSPDPLRQWIMGTSTGPSPHSVKSLSYKVCLPETHMDIRALPVLFWAPRKSGKCPLYCFLSYKPVRKWKGILVLNSTSTCLLWWTQILCKTFFLPYFLRKVKSNIGQHKNKVTITNQIFSLVGECMFHAGSDIWSVNYQNPCYALRSVYAKYGWHL